MKILLMISGGDVGGAKTHIISLLQGLMQTETVRVVCFMDGECTREARALGADILLLESNNLPAVVKTLKNTVRTEKFEIVHCHGARANLVGSLLRRHISAPVITTVHSDYRLDYLGRPLSRLTYGTLNSIALRFLDAYVGVSDPMSELLISRGFDPQRIYTIYNGIDFTPRNPEKTRKAYLTSLGLSDWNDSVLVGIAARLSAVKDVGTLIRGFALAVKACPQMRLLIAGDGEQSEELHRLAEQLCPENTVHFAGWVSDMDSFYHALDVNTLTSLSETFPYALTEGARMRCATVASRVGGVPYLIEDGVNGLLFPAKEAEQLAGHLVRLARDGGLRKKLGDALYDRASADFSIEATVQRQKEVYETVLRRRERKNRKRDGVMICGAYGKGNAGDDAILKVIIRQMQQIDRDLPLYVLSRKPRETAARYRIGAIHTFDFLRFFRFTRHTALYLSGGGSLMQDVTSSRSLWYYLFSMAAAKKRGNRVIMYGCGVGPVRKKANRTMARRVIDRCADTVTVRESDSMEELKAMGITRPRIVVTADPATLLDPAPAERVDSFLRDVGLEPGKRFAVLALRPWNGLEERFSAITETAAYLQKTYGLSTVFLAMEKQRDLPLCLRAAQAAGEGALALAAPEDSATVIGIFRRAELVLSLRLHALIFASGVGTPMVGISYDPKVTGFLRYLGCEECLTVGTLTASALCSRADRALADPETRRNMAAHLRALAALNETEAARLLEEET